MSLYLVLEGPDGCGKSVQSKRLRTWVEEGGREVRQENGQRRLLAHWPGEVPVVVKCYPTGGTNIKFRLKYARLTRLTV